MKSRLTDIFEVFKDSRKIKKKWLRYVLKINESIINTSAIKELVQRNTNYLKK